MPFGYRVIRVASLARLSLVQRVASSFGPPFLIWVSMLSGWGMGPSALKRPMPPHPVARSKEFVIRWQTTTVSQRTNGA